VRSTLRAIWLLVADPFSEPNPLRQRGIFQADFDPSLTLRVVIQGT
jgi:hypothetical protein